MQFILDKEVDEFVESLQKPTKAKWLRNVTLLTQYGNNLGMPHARRLTNNLSELRIRGAQEVRAFFSCVGDQIYVVHAFIKKTQKIPNREIEIAQKRLQQLT